MLIMLGIEKLYIYEVDTLFKGKKWGQEPSKLTFLFCFVFIYLITNYYYATVLCVGRTYILCLYNVYIYCLLMQQNRKTRLIIKTKRIKQYFGA